MSVLFVKGGMYFIGLAAGVRCSKALAHLGHLPMFKKVLFKDVGLLSLLIPSFRSQVWGFEIFMCTYPNRLCLWVQSVQSCFRPKSVPAA